MLSVKLDDVKSIESTTKIAQSAPKQATGGNCSEVNAYQWDTRTAYAICMAESGGNHRAFNPSNYDGSNDKGLMQINSIHVASGLIGDDERYDAHANMRAAYAIYKGSGFRAWSAFNNGAYTKWL